MLRKALFEAVASMLGEPKRRLIPGVNLQPDPRDGENAVNPHRCSAHSARGDAPASLLRPHPVRELDTSGTIRHQPDRAEDSPTAQDSDGELTSSTWIPG
jgi:hypothetical protein